MFCENIGRWRVGVVFAVYALQNCKLVNNSLIVLTGMAGVGCLQFPGTGERFWFPLPALEPAVWAGLPWPWSPPALLRCIGPWPSYRPATCAAAAINLGHRSAESCPETRVQESYVVTLHRLHLILNLLSLQLECESPCVLAVSRVSPVAV